MIRCKCGKFTNFGLTCSNCRSSYYPKTVYEENQSEEIEREVNDDIEEEISFEELEDFLEKDEDD